MVRYPDGRCRDCGEREYATRSGETWCPNCSQLAARRNPDGEPVRRLSSVE